MEIRKYGRNSKKKKKQFKLWDLVLSLFLLLILISGGVFIYKEQNRQQEISNLQTRIQELQEQARQQYHLQNSFSTTYLAESSEVHAFFTDLLTTYAEKFARSKGLRLRSTPLEFGGFYLDENISKGFGEMGRCSLEKVIYPIKQKVASISLNRLYLLNKFGCEKYFTSNPEYGDYSYLDISFNKMLETCSHEIAHYIQLVKWGKSSCESDLVLNNGKYDKELAREHQKWTENIYQLIKEDFSKLEQKWKEI